MTDERQSEEKQAEERQVGAHDLASVSPGLKNDEHGEQEQQTDRQDED